VIDIFPDFHLPTRVFINPDVLEDAGQIISPLGSRAVIITTSTDLEKMEGVIETLSSRISSAGTSCIVYDEIPEIPNTEFIDSASYFCKRTNCDLVIGFGGIESINAAKVVSLLMNNFLFCDDLFSNPVVNPPVNLVTIPTHPIFGFEIMPLFYVTDIHDFSKKIYRNNFLYPTTTLIDPNISIHTNEEETAAAGICSLAIATESIVSKVTNDFTNTYSLKAMDLIFKNLTHAYRDPRNPQPRHPLAVASILSGMAFNTSYFSLSLAIGMALSSKSNIPMDKAMALILPHVMEYNLTASPGRYVQMAKVMDEDVREITVIEAAIKAIEGVRRIEMDVDIPQRLSQFGILKSEFTSVAEIASKYPFIENAPRPLSRDEIETILIAAY
jgi:alcohol dehydrogenase class IV